MLYTDSRGGSTDAVARLMSISLHFLYCTRAKLIAVVNAIRFTTARLP